MSKPISNPRKSLLRWPPPRDRDDDSTAIDTSESQLFRSVAARVRLHPGHSGIVELRSGRDAFAARAHLADVAERTLDIQCYIWRADVSGTLLFEAIRRAADRGVRVRILLDDNNTSGQDDLLAALDAHPRIAVRLFNPFLFRRLRTLNIYDFSRLNRRMHNKSFTVDQQVTIVGGRNIGDEYFDAHDEMTFIDVDVMAIGPVVKNVATDFESYWQNDSAYRVSTILRKPSRTTVQSIAAAAQKISEEAAARTYIRALHGSRFVQDLLAGTLHYQWAEVRMVSDDPAKILGRAAPHDLLPERLSAMLRDPTRELQLISAYLVPTRAGVDALVELTRKGVKISVLTNSLEATDVGIVHAGYAKRRKALLEAGVEIYELKRISNVPSGHDRKPTRRSASSLHAKTFAVDRARVFVGSFNFDPRSAQLNTEMGLLMESPTFANQVAEGFTKDIPQLSYKVEIARSGLLHWVERRGEETIVHKREPGATPWRRVLLFILSKLPIEWLL